MNHLITQRCSGWGRYPGIDAAVSEPRDLQALRDQLRALSPGDRVPRGRGRSYGDAALAPEIISSRWLDELIDLDEDAGILRCGAGTTLATLIEVLLPGGWMLPVVPGTAEVSVAGAVAADVHGKNHHLDGCFSGYVDSLRLMNGEGEVIECSAQQHPEVFRATCGGMGLTGYIVDVSLRLTRVPGPMIRQRCLRTGNLQETLVALAEHNDSPYSVAWLDCMSRGHNAGRSLVFLGEHYRAPPVAAPGPAKLNIPFSTPGLLLNQYTIRGFNALYYRIAGRAEHQILHSHRYFFPLDGIRHWNRLYGRRGFLQYQFVVPDASAAQTIRSVLARTRKAGIGSFLSVLKRTGPANRNPLSFPLSGYTLALDFKYHPDLLPLLDMLDDVIAEAGGRVYLAKDARLSQERFQRMYPHWEAFVETRRALGAHHHFNSLQSRRLGL
ncbi:MAG: FAD-binding oxidoreductase [Pseudohongiellaceae bacterium]